MENPSFIFSSGPIELKEEGKDFFVEGYVSTSDLDLVNDVVTKSCILDMAEQMKERTIKLDIEHESFRGNNDVEVEINKTIIPAAKIDDFLVDKKGLKIRGMLNRHIPRFEEVKGSIEDGFLDAFSIAYIPTETKPETRNGQEVRLLNKVNLLNVAFTGNPVNTHSAMTNVFAKSLQFLKDKEDKTRGEGQGVGGPKQGDGGAEICKCPKCGAEYKKEKGKPCSEKTCPKCKIKLEGKSLNHNHIGDTKLNKQEVKKMSEEDNKETESSETEEGSEDKKEVENKAKKPKKPKEGEEEEEDDEKKKVSKKDEDESKEESTEESADESKESESSEPETKSEIQRLKEEMMEVKAILKKPLLKSKVTQQDKSNNFVEEKSLNPLDVIA
jgi:flagellar biosynthesis GTPase FlhF